MLAAARGPGSGHDGLLPGRQQVRLGAARGGRGGGAAVGGAARLRVLRDIGQLRPRHHRHVPGILLTDPAAGAVRPRIQNSQVGKTTGD